MPSLTGSPEFNIDAYLDQRAANPSFTMVEIGHAEFPLPYQQPFEFEGDRRYFGFESWLRDPLGSRLEDLAELHYQHGAGKNITYMYLDPGGVAIKKRPWRSPEYEGSYDPTTPLPAGIADEVVLANVFSDPHVAFNLDRTTKLLSEVSRLAKVIGGEVVLREIGTPQYLTLLSEQILAEAGLQIDARVEPSDEAWGKLEPVYEGERDKENPRTPQPGSFYLFLSKIQPREPFMSDLGSLGLGQTGIDLP